MTIIKTYKKLLNKLVRLRIEKSNLNNILIYILNQKVDIKKKKHITHNKFFNNEINSELFNTTIKRLSVMTDIQKTNYLNVIIKIKDNKHKQMFIKNKISNISQ